MSIRIRPKMLPSEHAQGFLLVVDQLETAIRQTLKTFKLFNHSVTTDYSANSTLI